MIRTFCGVVALVLFASAVVNAAEAPGFEVRTRNAIGRLAIIKVQVSTKSEADGTVVLSFQAPAAATYVINYANGPKAGKVAATVRTEKAGPVSTKIK